MTLDKNHINKICNKMNIDNLIKHIEQGEISLDDLLNLTNERRQLILQHPNTKEVEEWSSIEEIDIKDNTKYDYLEKKLNKFCSNWPNSTNCTNAKNKLQIISDYRDEQNRIQEEQNRIQEEQKWEALDKDSYDALIEYLQNNSNTTHYNEIDNYLWNFVIKHYNSIDGLLDKFISDIPTSQHKILIEELKEIKQSDDIFAIYKILTDNNTPEIKDSIQSKFNSLKETELLNLKYQNNNYDINKLKRLIEYSIIQKQELVNIIPEKIIDNILEANELEDLKQNYQDIICPEDHTDVYLWGTPSTGKTCVLMGLQKSDQWDVDSVKLGGEYSQTLREYADYGKLPDRTSGEFITAINGTIRSGNNNKTNKVNLIELSGEEFQNKIAKNEDGIISFEDMGSGATELLKNSNRKMFFIIIDPCNTSPHQRKILRRMIDLFKQKENKAIMDKVDAIHIIVTKADTLGSEEKERDEKAASFINEQYDQEIRILKEFCKNEGKNRATGNEVFLYTFSLGQFYFGQIFDYDIVDSNKIINVIRENSQQTKKHWLSF